MSKLAEYLNRHIVGNVFERPTISEQYATDRSIISITPRLVALPSTTDDVRRLLRFSHQLGSRGYNLSVTVRGTGRDKTGACLGKDVVLSLEKLKRIEELDTRGRLVRVQPGVTLGELNAALRLHGFWLPIGYDPECTIGGLIANGPNDDMFGRFGGIQNYVERAEIVLSSGDLIQLGPLGQMQLANKLNENTAEGELYRQIDAILDEQADTILDLTMQPPDTAGYYGITKVREGHTTNLLPLLFASQGTLGVITDIILRIEPLPPTPHRFMASFHDLRAAQRFLNFVSDLEPYLLKIYDLRILEEAALFGKKSDLFTRKFGKGVLVMAGFDFNKFKSRSRIKRCLETLPENVLRVEENLENAEDFEEIPNLLLSYLNNSDRGQRTPILDEVYIPSMNFSEYLEGIKVLEQTLDTDLPVFGSFITGSYNVRPDFDTTSLEGRHKIAEFLRLYTDLVNSCQGSITGNAPEGRVKTLTRSRSLGVGERQLYSAIKEAFDPHHLLGPGVKLDANTHDIIRQIRTREKGGVITP